MGPHDLKNPNALGDVFFFEDGTFVEWGLAKTATERLLTLIKPAEIKPEPEMETEFLEYRIRSSQEEEVERKCFEQQQQQQQKNPKKNQTFIEGEVIMIGSGMSVLDRNLAQLAYSHGLARSTKLALLETKLDKWVDETRFIPDQLAAGRGITLSRAGILKRIGEILCIRSDLNHTDLSDLPDLYWSRADLEEHYSQIIRVLDFRLRIAVLNRKVDYASELATTIRDNLNEQHGVRLEWIIISLIAVEVFFELARAYNHG